MARRILLPLIVNQLFRSGAVAGSKLGQKTLRKIVVTISLNELLQSLNGEA
jgi:hypothetical protein